MDVVYKLVVVTHLLGMAALVGGYAVGRPAVNEVMIWGARLQLITGIVLVGMAESIDSLDVELNMTKIVVKLVISVLVTALAEMGRAGAKRGRDTALMVHAAGILGVVNVVIAAMWN